MVLRLGGCWGWLALLASLLPCAEWTQHITIDGHFSPAQTLAGPNYAIGANLGKQVGGNLFQSFGIFGLATSESATFSGPAAINNVIGRVTGGNLSSINGKIQSTITGANLYLINPSGMVFGPNATVNVSGSFHASTADYLKMSDGKRFQATNPSGSTLSAAPPAAFGFLTASPAKITVNGSKLGPVPGTLGLVGGPVAITGGKLKAPAGTIHVASVAGAGEVPVDPRNTAALTVTNFGRVTITGGSRFDVSNPSGLGNGGSVFIHSGTLTLDASEINADNYGSGPGGELVLHGDSQVTLSNSAKVHAMTYGSGSGAGVVISTSPSGQLTLTNGAALTSSAQGSGSGGPIAITAGSVLLDGGAALNETGIFSTTSGAGGAGSITIVAGELTLHNFADVLTVSNGAGAAGGVAISVGSSLIVDSGASLGTVAYFAGNAGNVAIKVAGPVTIDMTNVNAAALSLDGIGSSASGTGNAGDVSVTARALTITNGGTISSVTGAAGNSGDVSVSVSGMLSVSGVGENPAEIGPLPPAISASTYGSGNAGKVAVTAGILSIVTNGEITSATFASGNGGSITVEVAGRLSIDGTGGTRSF